jgi:hypothetical protein
MRAKPGVRIDGITTETLRALLLVDALYARHGWELRVTSINDGKHKVGSLHPKGRAFDVGTKELPGGSPTRYALRAEIEVELGPEFDVVLEEVGGPNEHIHIEHDPAAWKV